MSSGSMNFLLAAGAFALALQSSTPAPAADVVEVNLDQAKLIELPDNALTVIIGNPAIVDIALLRSGGRIVLTGKSFGETNLITVDKNGGVINESRVRVSAGGALLTVQRGMERESYSCSSRCEPTVSLGDSSRYMGENINAVTNRNAAVSGGTIPRQ